MKSGMIAAAKDNEPKQCRAKATEEHPVYMVGCLTMACSGLLIIWATICALVWLARWGFGW